MNSSKAHIQRNARLMRVVTASLFLFLLIFFVLYLFFSINNKELDPSDVSTQAQLDEKLAELCAEKYFDILMIVDSSGSPAQSGVDDDMYAGIDQFVDSLDLANNRLSIMEKFGWVSKQNTGFLNNAADLKAQYRNFGFTTDPPCKTYNNFSTCPAADLDDKTPDAVRNFLSSNRRYVNGILVPVTIILFDDGDRAQVPQSGPDQNTCNPSTSDLQAWQALDEFGDINWVRFETALSNNCPTWQNQGVMSRGAGSTIAYNYVDGTSGDLYYRFADIFREQCGIQPQYLPLQIEKEAELDLSRSDANKATINYTINVRNPNIVSVNDAIVIDRLPAAINNVFDMNPNGMYDSNNKTIRWNITSILSGEVITYTYSADVLRENFGQIDNIATVYTDDNQNDLAEDSENNDEDNAGILIDINSGVLMSKDASVQKVGSQYEVSYTIGIQNIGDIELVNLTLKDNLDNKVQETWVTNIESEGALENKVITWTPINLATSEQKTFTYKVNIPESQIGQYINIAILTDEQANELARDDENVSVPPITDLPIPVPQPIPEQPRTTPRPQIPNIVRLPNTSTQVTNLVLPLGLALILTGIILSFSFDDIMRYINSNERRSFEKSVSSRSQVQE